MHVKRRRLPNFETCSVVLFASLVFYGPLPYRAETARSAAPVGVSRNSTAVAPHRSASEQLREAFTHSNRDSQLSRAEAAMGSGLSHRFDRLDTRKDGSISSAEFDEALK